jgi:hypothetical protein
VGVPTPIIVEDYALSASYFAEPRSAMAADDWRHPPLLVDSPPEYMEAALEHLDREHGGARTLLRGQGLTDEDLDRLVDLLTEPVGGVP